VINAHGLPAEPLIDNDPEILVPELGSTKPESKSLMLAQLRRFTSLYYRFVTVTEVDRPAACRSATR
jgi:hypothetical protein